MENYLVHWGFKKGEAKKDHKYISRFLKNGKWQYVYKTVKSKLTTDHKYLVKEFKNGKWVYSYSPNKYESTSSNYQQVKQDLTNSSEWKSIVARKDPEYVKTDKAGNTVYDYDSYLTNKKHPILDALKDYGNGRKVTILDQNIDTVIAGTHDYVKMGQKTVENVMTIGVGLLTAKLMNQQGSFDDEKQQITQTVNEATSAANDALNTYSSIKNTVNTVNTVSQAAGAAKTVSNLLSGNKITYSDIQNVTNTAIKAYAAYNGISESEAKKQLIDYGKQLASEYVTSANYGTYISAANTLISEGKLTYNDINNVSSKAISAYASYYGISESAAKKQLTELAKSTAMEYISR